MVKYYFLAAAALLSVATADARELKFCQGDKTFANNERFVWSECKIDDYGDEGKDYVYDPHISILSDVNASNVTVTAKCTSGQSIQLCCGGSCEVGPQITKQNIAVTANTPLATQLEQMGSTSSADELIPHVEVELTAQYADDDASLIKLEVVFDTNSGVSTVTVDNDFYATQGAIVYNIAGASEMSLYDMKGRRVLGATLSGNGTISTDGLSKGLYVYTLDGSTTKSGKIFVR